MPHLYFIRLIFCLLAFGVFGAQAQEREVRIAADEWPPMTGSELHEGGFSVHLAKAVLTDLGYKVTVEFMPWKRVERTQPRAEYDLITSIWYSKDREHAFAYTKPYHENKVVFVSLKENAFVYENLASLKDKRIGIVSAYSYPKYLLKYDKAIWDAGIDLNQNIKKLLGKRLDMIIGTDAVIRYEVQHSIDNSTPLYYHMGNPLEVRPLHMAVNRTVPDHLALAKKIDETILKFKEDGRFDALKKQHGLE